MHRYIGEKLSTLQGKFGVPWQLSVFVFFRPKITFNSGYSPKLWLNFLLHAWSWKIDFPEELNIRAQYSEVDRKNPSVFLPWALLLLLSHQVPLDISVYFTTISSCLSGFAAGWRWEHLQGRISCQSCCWLWYLTEQRPSVTHCFISACLREFLWIYFRVTFHWRWLQEGGGPCVYRIEVWLWCAPMPPNSMYFFLTEVNHGDADIVPLYTRIGCTGLRRSMRLWSSLRGIEGVR